MTERKPSIADSLVAAETLLDARYRIDRLVRRMATASIHVATHRNGSTAWLKLPVAKEHADRLAREASVANTLGSPLLVRDDGMTPDGVPYLVLDPPDGESLASARARGIAGARVPLPRVLTVGDSVARVVASLHALGYVSGGLHEEDVLVLASGEIALLDLHAIEPKTDAGVVADVRHVTRVLALLVADVADTRETPTRSALEQVLAQPYADVGALQIAWRAASPDPIAAPVRAPPGSFPHLGSSPGFDVPPSTRPLELHATPLASSLDAEAPADPEGSVIGYLRSASASLAPPSVKPRAGTRERTVLQDPLSNVRELPRLVQATCRAQSPARVRTGRLIAGISLAVMAALLVAGAALLALSPRARAPGAASLEPAQTAAAPLLLSAPMQPAPPPAQAAPPQDKLELTSVLRSEAAPPDRYVFVDGKCVGKTPLSVTVPCGSHVLQMVTGAPKQRVELRCGGESVVRYDAKGHWSLRSR